jgi:hypothetical protein
MVCRRTFDPAAKRSSIFTSRVKLSVDQQAAWRCGARRGARPACDRRAPGGGAGGCLVLPAGELLGQLLGTLELRPPIELVGIGPMTALDLPVALRANLVGSAGAECRILEVPGEVGAELGPMIGLNPLDRHRQSPPHLVDESDGGLDRVVVVDLQDSKTRRLVDGP